MTVLAQNLKTIRSKLSQTQITLASLLDIGFRTYVRYETGKRDAPVSVFIKMAKLGNISLDRLLTTTLTLENLKIPDTDATPTKPQKMEMVGGGLKEGKVIFVGLKHDHLITTDKAEKKLLSAYRKLNYSGKKKCLIDTEWILNNPKNFKDKKFSQPSSKILKEKNLKRLAQAANSVKIITLRK